MLVNTINSNHTKISFSRNCNFLSTPEKFTNRDALKLLKEELCTDMPPKEAATWMKKVKHTCKKLGIAPKRLPINSEHPGDLTGVEKSNIFAEIFYSVFNEKPGPKINLIC